jgi:flagellar protein FlbD
MIVLTNLKNEIITLNLDNIERIENVPETMITLTNGKKVMVQESMDSIIRQSVRYKASIMRMAGAAV